MKRKAQPIKVGLFVLITPIKNENFIILLLTFVFFAFMKIFAYGGCSSVG